jgi:trk system potassium uptake protein TrkH
MINSRSIFKILGFLLLLEGIFILSAVPIAMIYGESDAFEIFISSLFAIIIGGIPLLLSWNSKINISKKDGYIIVSVGWILLSVFGAIPFVYTGAIPSYTDAFFETMSGFTTTGASILNDIESLSHGLLYWRSLTQWIGGMGIIVLSLAILPLLGIGGMELFVAEVPGPVPDKLHPRVKGTAKRLWLIYVTLTVAQTLLLWIGDMDLYDAVCHSFTTMATGGYSTKQASVAHWDSPYIHYVIILFMFIAGTNFTLSYFAMHFRFRRLFVDEEFRYYFGIVFIFTLFMTLIMIFSMNVAVEESFRNTLFQVVSLITTTGYITSDYELWKPILIIALVILMFIGGSAGSTGGGIKVVRIVLVLKNSALELKRLIHPNAVIPVRYNRQTVNPQIITNVLAFVSFYFLISIVGVIIMSAFNYDLDTSLGAVVTCLGNVGPGLGLVGPVDSFSHVPALGKWFLSFLMLIGRLELFTVLILFTPEFWKK